MQSSIQSAPTPQRRAQPCIHLHTSIMSLSTGTGWRGGVCGLLLLLLELVVPHLARGQSSTVAVSNATSFVAALGGSGVDTILLDQATARVAVRDWPNATVVVARNKTITSSSQAASAQQPGFPALSLGKGYGRVQIGDGVWLTLRDVELVALAKVGLGASSSWGTTDLLALSVGATIRIENVIYRTLVCPPLQALADGFLKAPRPPSIPGVQSGWLLPTNTCVPTRTPPACFGSAALINDSAATQPAIGQQGGFTMHMRNVTMVCQFTVTDACVAAQGVAACMAALLTSIDPATGQVLPHAAADAAPGEAPAATAKVLVGAVLGSVLGVLCLLLAGGAALAVAQRRRRAVRRAARAAARKAAKQQQPQHGGGDNDDGASTLERGRGEARHHNAASTGATTSLQLLVTSGTLASDASYSGAVHALAAAAGTLDGVPEPAPGEDPDRWDEVRLGAMIGVGSFGRVYKARWRARDVAVKKILHSPAEAPRIQAEVELSSALDNPHVVQSLHSLEAGARLTPATTPSAPGTAAAAAAAFGGGGNNGGDGSAGVTPPGGGGGGTLGGSGYMFPSRGGGGGGGRRDLCLETWLVQELCDLGPLSMMLYSGRFSDVATGAPHALALLLRARDVAAGMAYLHARGVCHGDLKSENVLLKTDAEDPMGCVAKICDFGLSRALAEGRTHCSTRHWGTITHMAPEVLTTGHLRFASDVYSFGVMLWEMATLSRPYAGLTQGEIVHRIVVTGQQLAFTSRTPRAVRDLAHSCWARDPTLRPRFTQVVATLTVMIKEHDGGVADRMARRWAEQERAVEAAAREPKLRPDQSSSSAAAPSTAAATSAPSSSSSAARQAAMATASASTNAATGYLSGSATASQPAAAPALA